MKRLLFISCTILFCVGLFVPVYGQSSKLEGAWILNKVELFKYSETGEDSTEIGYNKNTYKDIISGAFESLVFKGNKCNILIDGEEQNVSYVLKESNLDLNIMAVPHFYNLKIIDKNNINLSRDFNDYNTNTHYNIKLYYLKNK